jgi:subtilase family serine protease
MTEGNSMGSSTAPRVYARRALVTLGAAVLTIPFIASSAFSAPTGSRSVVAGSLPAWATSSRAVSTPASTARISFNVVLPLRDAAGAAKLAAAVSNPKSAAYGHYLTAAGFNARYAPTASQVSKVESFLKTGGINVTGVAAGNRWVQASGTVAQVNAAFSTTLRNYRYKGKTLRAPAKALSVPRTMSGLIAGFVGVSQDGLLRTPSNVSPANVSPANVSPNGAAKPSDALPPPSTCSTYWDQHEQVAPLAYGKTSFPTPNCGYSPAQLRGAYGLTGAEKAGDTGRGVTVAIVDAYASSSMLADANEYSDLQGEPEFAPGQYSETVMGPFTLQDECGGEFGWNEEESLDVEAVHGMAPSATVHYVGAANCDTGIDDAVNYIIQNHLASIVSNSYSFAGEDGLGDEVATEHSEFVQAAAEGIGFYFSSGDNGDNVVIGAPHPEPDYPASDPLVTGVGGTDLAINPNGSYKFETSWGDDLDSVNTATSPSSYTEPVPGSFLFGGGGGVSALFTEPAYQKLAVPSKLAKLNGGDAMRVVPDIAAVGDPETGYLIGLSDGSPFTTVQIGGTSLAAPVIAGIQAVASQGRAFPIGFANPLLYTLHLTGVAFHDVKAPSTTLALVTNSGRSLLTLADDSSLTATRGYDDTTGLGTPNGIAYLVGEKILP